VYALWGKRENEEERRGGMREILDTSLSLSLLVVLGKTR